MQCRQPLLLIAFQASSTDCLEELVLTMCYDLCVTPIRLVAGSPLPLTSITVQLNQNQMLPEHHTIIGKWLEVYPTGRVALIFAGQGTDCGRLLVPMHEPGSDAHHAKLDPLQVCSSGVHVDLSDSHLSYTQVVWKWLGTARFNAVFHRHCFAIIFPSRPDPRWAHALTTQWLAGQEPRYGR